MADVSEKPDPGKRTDPPSNPPKPTPPLRWDDRAQCGRWLGDLREQVFDAIAAGEDATRRPRKRFFSRHQARRRLRSAERAIFALFTAAERGLDPEAT